MIAKCLAMLAMCALLLSDALAEMTVKDVDLPTCTLHTRTIQGPANPYGPHFLMMSGVPLSGAVFRQLGERLATRLSATSTFIDFPGVGGSALKGVPYGLPALRTCLRDYLGTQPAHVFVVGDLGMPVVAPLLPATPNIRALAVLNSVIKPSQVNPPFPMNIMRCCPRLAIAIGSITPRAVYEMRIRDIGLGRPDDVDPEEIHALYREMRHHNGLHRLARLMNDIELDEDGDQAILDGLATPIPQLFLWGEADPALGSEYKNLPALAANQQLIVFPQGKHYLMLDHADELTEAIVHWIAGLP
jgi:pimeloyl-ACP methyl ester carboxylesterase